MDLSSLQRVCDFFDEFVTRSPGWFGITCEFVFGLRYS